MSRFGQKEPARGARIRGHLPIVFDCPRRRRLSKGRARELVHAGLRQYDLPWMKIDSCCIWSAMP